MCYLGNVTGKKSLPDKIVYHGYDNFFNSSHSEMPLKYLPVSVDVVISSEIIALILCNCN